MKVGSPADSIKLILLLCLFLVTIEIPHTKLFKLDSEIDKLIWQLIYFTYFLLSSPQIVMSIIMVNCRW